MPLLFRCQEAGAQVGGRESSLAHAPACLLAKVKGLCTTTYVTPAPRGG